MLFLLFALLATGTAHAHLGSKDVFEQVTAGPYKLFITIRPPVVIPGVATVEVRATGAAIDSISITPTPLTGEAANHPPTPDILVRSTTDPSFYTGGVWMMGSGSWQVRFAIDGPQGHQTTSIPVPAMALSTLKMQRNLGIPLALLGLFLVVTMAGLVAAAVREARLPPGAQPTPSLRRRGLIATVASLVVMALAVYYGGVWWKVDAANYAEDIYHPLNVDAHLTGNVLDLDVHPFRSRYSADFAGNDRSNTDFLPDHGHLMHLYAIRQPGMDAVFHLHPTLLPAPARPGDFQMALPAMPPGEYKLYGDVVHANGFPETLVTTLTIPAGTSANSPGLGPDDASALPAPLSANPLGPVYKLPDGYTMVWDKPATLTATTPYSFHFRLLAPDGTPAKDAQPYMGMAGHAAFIKTDGTVFAHTHPDGSAAMAALDLANGSMSGSMTGSMGPMESASPMESAAPIPPAADFPYGFPTPGAYRIVIQMKHASTIETAVFDATVSDPAGDASAR